MRIFIAFLVLLLTVLAVSYWYPWEGPWVDRAVSKLGSQRLGMPLTLSRTSVRHWTSVHFDSGELEFLASKEKVRFGRGQLELDYFQGFLGKKSKIDILVNDLKLPGELWRKTPLTFLDQYLPVTAPFVVERLSAVWVQEGQFSTVHVLELAAGGIEIKGGLRFEQRRLTSAHSLFLISGDLLRKIPEGILPRLIRRMKNKSGVRVVFKDHVVTIMGSAGMLFQAQWQQ